MTTSAPELTEHLKHSSTPEIPFQSGLLSELGANGANLVPDVEVRQHVRTEALTRQRAARYRQEDSEFADWAMGYGEIHHEDLTQVRIYEMAARLVEAGKVKSRSEVYRILRATDRLCNAAMWLIVHQTYARNVYLDGRALDRLDFKEKPEGHTGGSLNMAPAYAGYLAINAITHITRAWLMGPGHCVSAVDSLNLLVDNMSEAHRTRYALNDAQLSNFAQDFYSYDVTSAGTPATPLGSHVNAHTAGGISEGGYLGFAELQYVHMPLPGERLVVFLSDGAFEEQRGSDWTSRWWRAEDCGLVTPILIANGRRIDQRSAIYQNGGVRWLKKHLQNNSFDPIELDGKDPAAFAWAILEMEDRLETWSRAIGEGASHYPILFPHGIAEAPKGFGFPGQGTNDAHNLPLGTNPFEDETARLRFNRGIRSLFVPQAELLEAVATLRNHAESGRFQEKDHALANRQVKTPNFTEPAWSNSGNRTAPMARVDEYFAELVRNNPDLRVRVGNPDEMRSNRLNRTLDLLKHRVSHPEPGMAEDIHGAVITALNEEAVACAAIGNKAGFNLVATYEAFAVKMLGAFRQELIFSRHQKEVCGKPPGWLSVPVILTSHTWENGKNEQSHQDPTFCEAMLSEMNDVSRVFFPADANSAVESIREVYRTRGEIWTLVIPKSPVSDVMSGEQAFRLIRDGALRLRGTGGMDEQLVLTAIGAYQLTEVLRASDRLCERNVPHAVIYMAEPGRFRAARDEFERAHLTDAVTQTGLYPEHSRYRIFASHTRPEAIAGLLQGSKISALENIYLGYRNRGGTLDINGMLFANRCTWGHILARAAETMKVNPAEWLDPEQLAAVNGLGNPRKLW